MTHPSLIDEDEDCERSVIFYGYVRGTHLKPGMRVHLIGLGDYNMEEVTVLPDPCPMPDKERERKVSLMIDAVTLKNKCNGSLKCHFDSRLLLFCCN